MYVIKEREVNIMQITRLSYKKRIKLLNLMNEFDFVSDEAYAHWIENGIPDSADKDDIEYIAKNDDLFALVCSAFWEAFCMV